jgi:toxin HigB-1
MSIKSFKDKELEKFWLAGSSEKINTNLRTRLLNKLDYLDCAVAIEDLNFPFSNNLHRLKGNLEGYWALSLSGAWRLIFQFKNGHAYDVYPSSFRMRVLFRG